MQKSTNKNICWNTPFTHHIDSVCQLFGLVMRFSHFYTFDQYANFFVFHLKIMLVGFFFVWFCVDVAANFRNPALFCRSLFYFDVLIRRGWHSCTLYAIACMHTWRMNIEQVCGMIGLAQWYWMMRFTYTMVNYLSAMERFWCTGLITWFFFSMLLWCEHCSLSNKAMALNALQTISAENEQFFIVSPQVIWWVEFF